MRSSIECIFTIDYEIYGNGEGSLAELVHEPSQKLKTLFDTAGVKLVNFVEVAELEKIAAAETDSAIDLVEAQVRDFYRDGHEIGLHIHPQWYNGYFSEGKWHLDYREYNLCALERARVHEIVSAGLSYLRRVIGDPNFLSVSFRAGNWLFQPTSVVAEVLASHGIRIDSSVFKGGLQRKHRLDYRPAEENGDYWRFSDDVNLADAGGPLLEVPIYSKMVFPWRMLKKKRLTIQGKGASSPRAPADKLWRLFDLLRLRYPLKFDFCRMTYPEMKSLIEELGRAETPPGMLKPVVAIGHSKDLVDFESIKRFIGFLQENGIRITTFSEMLPKLMPSLSQ